MAMTGFAVLLTGAIYLVAAQFRASVHASAGPLDANGNAAIAVHA